MVMRFGKFKYYPALRTRPAEMVGYQNLTESVKDGLLPIMTIGAWPRMEGLDESVRNIQSAVGNRPTIVDLTREATYQNDIAKALLSPDDNFKQWRDFVSNIPNAIPVVQFASGARLPQIIRQTRLLENATPGSQLAFRISDFKNDTNLVINSMSAMDSPQNALVIIDVGYIRETMAASIAACITAANEIREEIPSAEITVLSTSFPSSVTSHVSAGTNGMSGAVNIMERDLHEAIGADAVIYGDYGSIHARTRPATGGKYTPHIDCALYDAWVFERRPGSDAQGYIDAAQAILRVCPSCVEDGTWGSAEIMRAATGNIDGLKVRSSWIAVRVNMHITRQYELSTEVDLLEDPSEDDS
jgi:hypothetical protein